MITSDLEFHECRCRLRLAHRLRRRLGLAGRFVLGLVSGVCRRHVGGKLGRVGVVAGLRGRYRDLGNGYGSVRGLQLSALPRIRASFLAFSWPKSCFEKGWVILLRAGCPSVFYRRKPARTAGRFRLMLPP
jgi:hypothetical protein